MTEESEHYMDHLRIQVVYDLIRSRIQGCILAYDLIGSRTQRYKLPKTLLDPESEGTQVTCDLTGPETGTRDKHTTRPEQLKAVTTNYLPKQGMSRDFS
jgi:hypothetical protein